MNRPLAITLCVAVFFVFGAVPRWATAKPTKVALAQVEGDTKEGEVSAAVIDALDGTELVVVTPKEVTRAVEKLGLSDELTEKEIRKLQGELEAVAFVQSRLEKEGKSKTLKFKLFVRGKKQKGFSVSFTNIRSDKFKKAIKKTMVDKIGTATGDGAAEPKDPKDDEDKPKKKKAEEVADDPAAGKKKKKVEVAAADDDKSAKKKKKKKAAEEEVADKPAAADDDASAKKKTDVADDEATPKKSKKKTARRDLDDTDEVDVPTSVKATTAAHAANKDAVRADIGPSFQNRSLTFNSRQFTDGLGSPQAYKNSFVPGVRFEGEIFPLAFQNPNSPLAGLGLAAEVDQTISLTLHTSLQPNTALKATQRHYAVGLRYRIAFGSTPTSPTATLGIGYGRRTFTVDRSPLMDGVVLDLPDVDYKYFDPGLEVRVPLAAQIALFLGGRGMLITSAGPIVSSTEYGQAKVIGALGSGGLDIVLSNRFAVRVVGEVAQIGYTFTNAGVTKANNRDGDPTTPDVGGATDRSYGGAVTIAVLY